MASQPLDLLSGTVPPQRERMSLDGVWDFRLEPMQDWRAIRVPGVWQAQFDDLRDTQGVGWYRRHFAVPETMRGRTLVLGFNAVNYIADVWLNGTAVAWHEGGYLGFEAELPPELIWEDNHLEVRVKLPSNDRGADPDHNFQEIPHGKQSWYGPMGGIWQGVWLEARDPAHLLALTVESDLATGAIRLAANGSAAAVGGKLRAEVRDADGRRVALATGQVGAAMQLAVERPRAWSPGDPHLYEVAVDLLRDGMAVDTMRRHTGFRTIETRDGRFWLNGKPLYLRCALDQDYYPEGLYTLPEQSYLEDQMKKAKALGLNSVRCHIKVPDPLYYEICDRVGLLVWTEFPNFERFSDRAATRARDTAEGIIARDGHHPSIIAWTIINEDWGTRLTEDPEHRQWLIDQYDWLKARDPGRLVVDNSACFPNFHVKTDIEDYHYYRGVPDRRIEWDILTDSFARREGWTFSPYGDSQARGDEPLVCSEFGVWGLPNPRDLRRGGQADPWWFQTGQEWGEGVAHPHGLEGRFKTHFLDRAFGDFDRFIEATQWYQWLGLKYQIERLREHAPIQGYVITELTDIYWESNGLMDMERNLRVFHDRFAQLNADLVVLPGFDRWAWWEGERLQFRPRVATGGAVLGLGAHLHWRLEDLGVGGRVPVDAAAPGSVIDVPEIDIVVPALGEASCRELVLELRDGHGREIARGCETLALYPRPAPAADVAARVHTDDRVLADHLAVHGFRLADSARDADLIVAREMRTEMVEAVRSGMRALIVCEHGPARWLRGDQPPNLMPVPYHMDQAFPGLFAQLRDGAITRGDWITAFSWLRRTGPFAAIPAPDPRLAPMFDLSFESVTPHHVLVGLKPWEWEAHVPAGLVIGWGHKASAIVAERWFGRGKAVATTFRLTGKAPGEDPLATTLLGALVRQALSG